MIGHGILFYLDAESFDLVGPPTVVDRVQFNLETGDYDATAERDDNSAPFPAIFTGDKMEPYQGWLSAAAAGSLAGSYQSEDVTGYYLTPHDLGYGNSVAFDHDFVGREALKRLADEPTRTKGRGAKLRQAQVEPHQQVEIRAIVAPAPYVQYARGDYRGKTSTDGRHGRREESGNDTEEPAGCSRCFRQHRRAAAQLADRRLCVSRRRGGVLELAA